jgi:hypothetical protein
MGFRHPQVGTPQTGPKTFGKSLGRKAWFRGKRIAPLMRLSR